MKRTILFSIFAVALAFALPVLLFAAPLGRAAEAEAPAPAEETPGETPPERAPVLDSALLLTVHTDDGDVEMTMADYLPLALAGEMPASFDAEALKAQAVALRSYALYYREHRKVTHPDADVCTSPGCCAAFADTNSLRSAWGSNYEAYMAKLGAAVADTDGQYLVYESSPILAVFHSSSYLRTEDGGSVGVSAPYLVSVDTPETAAAVSNLNTTVEVSPKDFKETVLGAFPAAKLDDADPSAWVGAASLNAAGRVAEIRIGGTAVSGLALRQMFSLRSTDFTLAWDADGRNFVFRVSGYGHGVGMSQYGANLMAKGGADYTEILAHYYPETQLVMALA